MLHVDSRKMVGIVKVLVITRPGQALCINLVKRNAKVTALRSIGCSI